MRLVTYEIEHKSGLGVISRDGSWVYPLASLDMDYKTMQDVYKRQLEDYLDTFPGIVIAVSHDRYFLDRVVNRIFAFEGCLLYTSRCV